MARTIDMEKPLSPEDREYLFQKNRHDLIAENDHRYGGDSGEAQEEAVPPQRPESVHSPATTAVLINEDEEEAAPYSVWTVEELREELKDRGLPVSGTKPELVVRLEENDAVNDSTEA